MSGSAEALSDYPTNQELVPFNKATAWSDPGQSAASLMEELTMLQADDRDDGEGSRWREYQRLMPTYAAGVRLQSDEELRSEFYQHPYWKTHLGHRPKPDVHGAESAMRFAVAAVIGGVTRERNQRASMIGSAFWYLAVLRVAPEDIVTEIEKGRGPKNRSGFKHLAGLAAGLRKKHEAELQENEDSLDPEDTVQPKPHVVKVHAPPLLAVRLPPALYLVANDGEVLLSLHPDMPVPVELGDSPT